jgi:N-dimethylarginine dimethylaminohydrolase
MVSVKDEFSPLRKVIAHDALNAIDMSMDDFRRYVAADVLAAHLETGPVFRNRVIEQQAQLLRLLQFHGVEVVPPAPQPTAFCQVFTRDPCFAIGNALFLGSLRDSYRHPEVGGLVEICRQRRAVTAVCANGAMIEGGDVFVMNEGRTVLVGTNQHTNAQGIALLTASLGPEVEVVRVPHRALHLDCCFAPLPPLAPLPEGKKAEALVAGGLFHDEGLQVLAGLFDLIELDPEEATLHLAANLLWLNEKHVVSGVSVRETNQLLRSKGYKVHELDFSQLVCMWGSFRCATCPLVRG